MYASGPSDKELEAFGLAREDVMDNSVVEIWEENWVPFLIFKDLVRQWRIGMGGPTGLDYNTLYSTMTLMNVIKPLDMLDDIRLMESAALTEILRKRD